MPLTQNTFKNISALDQRGILIEAIEIRIYGVELKKEMIKFACEIFEISKVGNMTFDESDDDCVTLEITGKSGNSMGFIQGGNTTA